jgi:hypothetical protein
MILHPLKSMIRWLKMLVFIAFMAGRLPAAPAGPTLHFDYGNGGPLENPLDKFMYFVPLISPDPIAVSTNAGNTQSARVVQPRSKSSFLSLELDYLF